MPKNSIKVWVATKAFIEHDGKILVVRESSKYEDGTNAGKYDVVGGRVEPGQRFDESLLREIKEETGIDAEIGRPFFVNEWRPTVRGEQWQVVGTFFVAHASTDRVILGGDHDEFKWIDVKNYQQEGLIENLFPAFEAYLRLESWQFKQTITRDERIVGRKGLGLIQLFEGHGKGKTTAALGEALRAVGAGMRVGIVFFDKGGAHYAERDAIARHLSHAIDLVGTGRDRIDPVTGRFDFSITEEDTCEARRGLKAAQAFFEGKAHELVILDEINSTVDLGIVGESDVHALLDAKPDGVECIMTGRNAPASFKERAHLVTRMELQKHYFYSGVPARVGVDY